MTRLSRAAFTALLLTLHLVPAIRAEVPVRPRTQEVWPRTDLYFGTQQPNGTAVPDEEFAKFVDEEVTPRFPDGLTILTGFGQFRNSQGVLVKERSHLLILFYPPRSESNAKIEAIRTAYKQRFQQESVLRADTLTSISF